VVKWFSEKGKDVQQTQSLTVQPVHAETKTVRPPDPVREDLPPEKKPDLPKEKPKPEKTALPPIAANQTLPPPITAVGSQNTERGTSAASSELQTVTAPVNVNSGISPCQEQASTYYGGRRHGTLRWTNMSGKAGLVAICKERANVGSVS